MSLDAPQQPLQHGCATQLQRSLLVSASKGGSESMQVTII